MHDEAEEYCSKEFHVDVLNCKLILNIKDGGGTEPCSVYYQLKANCFKDALITFVVVHGPIKDDSHEINSFFISRGPSDLTTGWTSSPECKLNISVSECCQMLLKRLALVRLIISYELVD